MRKTIMLVAVMTTTMLSLVGVALADTTYRSGAKNTSPNDGAFVQNKSATLGERVVRPACQGVNVNSTQNLTTVFDSRGPGTTYCLKAGTYKVSSSVKVQDGDKVFGEPGTRRTVQLTNGKKAIDPNPVVKIVGVQGLKRIFDLFDTTSANPIVMQWLDISGAKGTCCNAAGKGQPGTGLAISAGGVDRNLQLRYLELHHNDAQGVGNMVGVIERSDLHHNGLSRLFVGHTAAGVKGVRAYEARFNYAHNNGGHAFWCDSGCGAVPGAPNGFWIHDNAALENTVYGVRYENGPNPASALIAGNDIHGNGGLDSEKRGGGVGVADGQNATVRNNVFGSGSLVIGGTARRFGGNYQNVAIRATDENRVRLRNNVFRSNTLRGEQILGCKLSGNTC